MVRAPVLVALLCLAASAWVAATPKHADAQGGVNNRSTQLLERLAEWERESEGKDDYRYQLARRVDSSVAPGTKVPRFDLRSYRELRDLGVASIPAMLELLQDDRSEKDIYRLCLVLVLEEITKRRFLATPPDYRITDCEPCRKKLIEARDATIAWWKSRDKHKEQFLADYADYKEHFDVPGAVLTVTTRSLDRKSGEVKVKEELTDLGKAHAKLLSWGIEALPWMAELIKTGNYELVGPFVAISGCHLPSEKEVTLKDRVEGFLLVWWEDSRGQSLLLPEVSAAKLK